MTGEDATRAVILWAINSDAPVPNVADIDEDGLYHTVTHHRIVSTVLPRLESARPAWCRPSLLMRLRFHLFHVKERTRKQIALAVEITRAMEARGEPAPIFVKGFAGYALTNRADNLHYSGDLDTFAADLPRFWDVLHALGYTGKRKYTHEWAKMYHPNAGVTIDVHESFPVPRYPDGVRTMSPDQLLATSNTGHWQIPGVDTDNERVFKGGTIVWDDLRRYQNPGVVPGSQTLRFPSPEVLCLIHCAHAFRSALMRLHLNSLGGERLNELLTIRSLTHLPAFDKVLFEKLMHGWGASDAVQFINLLTTSFLGSAVLPGGIPHDVTRLFPEQLPYGGWVSLQSAHDFLFPRGIEQIMAQLDAPIVALPFAGNVSALPRLLLFGEQRTDPHIEIAWQDRETLLLHWTFAPSALANEGEIVAHFGADSFVRVRTQGGAVAETEQKGDFYRAGQRRTDLATVQVEARQSVVTIVCPVPALPPPITGWLETTLPLMLSFRAASEGDAPAPVYYIPLRLQPFRARPNAV